MAVPSPQAGHRMWALPPCRVDHTLQSSLGDRADLLWEVLEVVGRAAIAFIGSRLSWYETLLVQICQLHAGPHLLVCLLDLACDGIKGEAHNFLPGGSFFKIDVGKYL